MNDLKETKGFFEAISEQIHYFVRENVHHDFVLFLQIVLKLLFFFLIILLIDNLLKLFFKGISYFFQKKIDQFPIWKALYESKVLNSIANFLSLGFGQELIKPFMGRHPKSHIFLERTFAVVMIIAGYLLYKRFLKSIERYYILKNDFYRLTAIRAITQSLNIIGIFFFGFLGMMNIFGVNASTIWGSLTAMTAVLLLVFRDTILGFVTGIHVSTSRNIKVGDWIGIPKYNIEGNIEEINLLTTKISNFDKTVSTIPTYDLLSTEIKNLQVMSESNTRRIKRSINFNINSFKFLNREDLDRLAKINLIKDYILEKKEEISNERLSMENSDLLINGRQLTNIGVFREYVFNFLKTNPHIQQDGTLLVRQLENTHQGMPLEIYCFTNNSVWENYEDIQADIFDHLLVASREFDLQIMQFVKA